MYMQRIALLQQTGFCFVCKQSGVCLTIRITREQEVRATPEKLVNPKDWKPKMRKGEIKSHMIG
jgi:hypothetical protein